MRRLVSKTVSAAEVARRTAKRTIPGVAPVGILVAALLALGAPPANASSGTIEVSGEHFTFHARSTNTECTPYCIGWYSAAYMAPTGHCASAEDPVGTSGVEIDTTPGESELTFSGSVDQAHIGAYEICLFVYHSSRELVATAPYQYPSPSGSIGSIVDFAIPFQPGDELTVYDTVTEPYTGPPEWSWTTALAALPGQLPCPVTQPAAGAYGPIIKLALTEGQTLHIAPPVASGTLTFCLYVDIYRAPEEDDYLVAEKTYAFPTIPTPAPKTPPPAARYKPLTLSTAGSWVKQAVKFQFHYTPAHYRANNCRRRSPNRYRCNTSWRHSHYKFTGWVEIGQVNPTTGHYTYGLHIIRTDTHTHRHKTITIRY